MKTKRRVELDSRRVGEKGTTMQQRRIGSDTGKEERGWRRRKVGRAANSFNKEKSQCAARVIFLREESL